MATNNDDMLDEIEQCDSKTILCAFILGIGGMPCATDQEQLVQRSAVMALAGHRLAQLVGKEILAEKKTEEIKNLY